MRAKRDVNGDYIRRTPGGGAPILMAKGMPLEDSKARRREKRGGILATIALTIITVATFCVVYSLIEHSGAPYTAGMVSIFPGGIGALAFIEDVLGIK